MIGRSKISRNGEESEVETMSTWKMSVQGDVLGGTLERTVKGIEMPDAGPQPISGRRIKP